MKPRILWFTDAEQDLGADHLFDGLRSLLGDDGIIDYPSKALFHTTREAERPTLYSYPEHGLGQGEIADQLRNGRFDLAVLSSERAGAVQAAGVLAANTAVPLVLTDFLDPQETVRHAPPFSVAMKFRAQLFPGNEHEPLHFTYPGRWAVNHDPRDTVVCFYGLTGHGRFPRREMWSAMEQAGVPMRGGVDVPVDFPTFRAALKTALVAWTPPGCHWDSLRYWEAAAHGCAILADARTRQNVRGAFSDDAALYYTSTEDLVEKALWLVSNPVLARIRGHQAFAEYCARHTSAARAMEFLRHVSRVVG